jgi:hypothetical protein
MAIDLDASPEFPSWSASLKQRRFIRNLIEQRAVDETVAKTLGLLIVRDDFEKVDATKLIDELLALPHRPKTVPAPDGTEMAMPIIDDLEISRFAIPVVELTKDRLIDIAGDSDLLFGEVREWKGHRFINALKGAPGDFNRIRIRGVERQEIVNVLIKAQYRYTKLYGEHYTCCGCCGASLTDETSRRLQLGPECRKRFGY